MLKNILKTVKMLKTVKNYIQCKKSYLKNIYCFYQSLSTSNS